MAKTAKTEDELQSELQEIENEANYSIESRIVAYGRKSFGFVAETDLELVNVDFNSLHPITSASKEIRIATWEGNLYLQIAGKTYRLTDIN